MRYRSPARARRAKRKALNAAAAKLAGPTPVQYRHWQPDWDPQDAIKVREHNARKAAKRHQAHPSFRGR